MGVSDTVILSQTSRYQNTTLYVDSEGNRYWGLWNIIDFPSRNDDKYVIVDRPNLGIRIDRLAKKYYNDYSLWWVICQANNISNPFTDLSDNVSYAKTIPVYSDDNRQCFVIQSLKEGAQYNYGQSKGLSVRINPSSLDVMVNSEVMEHFSELTMYPTLMNKSSDPKYWGKVVSNYVSIISLSTDISRPSKLGDAYAPTPPSDKIYPLYGGSSFQRIVLRIPSINNVHEHLST
jgi:hypothetical protein